MSAQAFAQSQATLQVLAGYNKGHGSFSIVVRDTSGLKLDLYVNDKHPSTAIANKKGYATFNKVRLSGIGKLSFTKFTSDLRQQPINYTRRFTIAKSGKVSFSTYHSASTKPASTSVLSNATQYPTENDPQLNAQIVPQFTSVLNGYEQLVAQGQSDAGQSNAGDVTGAFHAWYDQVEHTQNVADGNEASDAYVDASNLYYNNKLTAPDAVNNWGQDAGVVFDDIVTWGYDEDMVLGDQVMGAPSSSDQQTASSDLRTYQSDLSKAQADIQQLQ